ncbi:protein kinase domain-containing protein [Sorangium sp. So ce145]|uniref:protein kinase domain-containing protein n=1 Tax=Sorangium sp. So ce145 TaxID=3133285 RepID=UPI003F621192
MDISPGTIVGGKYLLERQLARPFVRIARDRGSVWVARELRLGVRVALKLFDPDAGATGEILWLDRWVRAAAELSSRHVVSVRDHGTEDGVVYLAMDLLSGEDLAARLVRRGRLSLDEAARVAAQAGDALQAAHAAGLLHQGLRPESLFLALEGDEEVVKVLDFGLPRAVAPRLVGEIAAEISAGALHYLSPEQIRAERTLDAQTDLWSLAAILFRAVTGHLPFPGDIASVVASKILLAPVPIATRLAPRLPAALDGFFEKAFARDRARRFRSVEEMVSSFARIAEHAPPPSSGLQRPPLSARASGGASARAPVAAFAQGSAAAPRAVVRPEAGAVRPEAGSEPPTASRTTPPDTLLGAESANVLRGLASPARLGWLLPVGLVALMGVATFVTLTRPERPRPVMAATGARAAVLTAVLAAGKARAARAAALEAIASPPARPPPPEPPQRGARAAATAPQVAASSRPTRPGTATGAATTGARARQSLLHD